MSAEQVKKSAIALLSFVIVAGVIAAWNWSLAQGSNEPPSYNQDEYDYIMSYQMTEPRDLEAWASDVQHDILPIAPPYADLALTQPGYPEILPFDAAKFPADFVKGLSGIYENTVPVYPITIVEDPKSRDRIFYNFDGNEFFSLKADKDYDPFSYLRSRWPSLYEKDADPEERAYWESLFDPARIKVTARLIAPDDVSFYLYARDQVAAAVAAASGGGGMMLMSGTGTCSEISFTSILKQESNDVIDVSLCVPDGITSIDLFYSTNVEPDKAVLGFVYFTLATNLPVVTNCVLYSFTNTVETNVFFGAAGSVDSDGDGWRDGEEWFQLGTDPASFTDGDGDGMGDGWETIYGLNTSSNDALLDPDGDGRTNIEEFNFSNSIYFTACIFSDSNPTNKDMDGDGVTDGPTGGGGAFTNGPDAFPRDACASKDSDCDGSPDFLSCTNTALVADSDDDADGLADGSDGDPLLPRTMSLKKTVQIDVFTTTNRSMAVAASFNGFSQNANCMRLISNGVWELIIDLNQPSGFNFKFVSRASFGQPHWGESGQTDFTVPMSDTAVNGAGSPDIVVSNSVVGLTRFLFNESTLAYTVDFPTPPNYAGPERFDASSCGGFLPYASGGNAQSGFGRVFGGIYFNHDSSNLYVGVGIGFVDPGSANENHLLVFLDTTPGGATSLASFSGTPEAIGNANNLSFGSGFTPNVALVLGYDFGDGWNIRECPNNIGQGVYDISNGTTIADFPGFSSTNGGGKISQWGDKTGTANAGMEVALSLSSLGLTVTNVLKAAAIIGGGNSGSANRFFSQEAYGGTASGSGTNPVTLTGADVYLSNNDAPELMSITNALFTDRDVMLQGFYFDTPLLVNSSHSWYRELRYKAENPSGSEFAKFTYVWMPPPQKSQFGSGDAGYAPFDHFDLGKYFQKNTTGTHYGVEQELIDTIGALKLTVEKPIVDLVMNHMFSGGVSRFNFTYSPHDFFEKPDGGGNTNKYFNDPGITSQAGEPFVCEHFQAGSFYPDVNQHHLYMKRGLQTWCNWLSTKVGYEGYRFDESQFMEPGFLAEFLSWGVMKDRFAVFEFWVTEGETSAREMQTWLGLTENRALIYDGVLREKLRHMCTNGATFNMSDLTAPSLPGLAPSRTMTYVDNHDTFRRFGALDYTDPDKKGVGSFKHLAYSYSLVGPGLPMVFYPDYFHGITQGTNFDNITYGFGGPKLSNVIDKLIWVRTNFIEDAATSYRATNNTADVLVMDRHGGAKDGCLLVINDNPSVGYTNTVQVHWTNGVTLVNVFNTGDTVNVTRSPGQASIAIGSRTNKVYINQALFGGGPP